MLNLSSYWEVEGSRERERERIQKVVRKERRERK